MNARARMGASLFLIRAQLSPTTRDGSRGAATSGPDAGALREGPGSSLGRYRRAQHVLRAPTTLGLRERRMRRG